MSGHSTCYHQTFNTGHCKAVNSNNIVHQPLYRDVIYLKFGSTKMKHYLIKIKTAFQNQFFQFVHLTLYYNMELPNHITQIWQSSCRTVDCSFDQLQQLLATHCNS